LLTHRITLTHTIILTCTTSTHLQHDFIWHNLAHFCAHTLTGIQIASNCSKIVLRLPPLAPLHPPPTEHKQKRITNAHRILKYIIYIVAYALYIHGGRIVNKLRL